MPNYGLFFSANNLWTPFVSRFDQRARKARRSWLKSKPRSVVASLEALAALLDVDSFGTSLRDVVIYNAALATTRNVRLRRALDNVRSRVSTWCETL